MMFRIMATMLLSLPGITVVAQQSPQEIRKDIFRTLTYYFNGFELNDPDALSNAYHEQAMFTLVELEKEGYEVMRVGEYLAAIADHPPKTIERSLTLKHLSWTGNVAFVHAVVEYCGQGQRIHDLLLLQKAEDGWEIVNRTSLREYASFSDQASLELSGREFSALDHALTTCYREWNLNAQNLLSFFAPHGDVSFVDPRQQILTRLDMAGYQDLLETQAPVRRRKQSTTWLFTSSRVAVVCVKTKVPAFGCHLVDYLTMVKHGDEWKIVHKATNRPARAIGVVP